MSRGAVWCVECYGQLQTSYSELPEESKETLRNSLLQHCRNVSITTFPDAVCTVAHPVFYVVTLSWLPAERAVISLQYLVLFQLSTVLDFVCTVTVCRF